MAYMVMAYMVMAYMVMAYMVMAYMVMAYIVMASAIANGQVRGTWPRCTSVAVCSRGRQTWEPKTGLFFFQKKRGCAATTSTRFRHLHDSRPT